MSGILKAKPFLVLALAAMVVMTVWPGLASVSGTAWSAFGPEGFSYPHKVRTDQSSYAPVTSSSLYVYQGTAYMAYQNTSGDIV